MGAASAAAQIPAQMPTLWGITVTLFESRGRGVNMAAESLSISPPTTRQFPMSVRNSSSSAPFFAITESREGVRAMCAASLPASRTVIANGL
jgi:hypothetical protein